MDLKILFEDNHVLVVFKPARMLSQGDETQDPSLYENVKEWIREKYSKKGNVYLGLLHRLDRPVAGLMIFAKTSKAASRISAQIRNKEVKKNYLAIVAGVPKSKEDILTQYYLNSTQSQKPSVSEDLVSGASVVELMYTNIHSTSRSTSSAYSLLSICPKTGKKHQIRVQLSSIGLPIVGDSKYGSQITYTPGEIALVASELEFTHPTRGDERIHIKLPIECYPPGFVSFLKETLGCGLPN